MLELVEGSLAGDDRRRYQRHLQDCDACRAVFAEVSRAAAEDAAAADAQASPGVAPARVDDDAAALPPVIGSQIGRYVITGFAGAGAMGTVYRARDAVLSREVALKLLTDAARGPDHAQQLAGEARHLAQISHPNVVSVFDLGTHGDQLYLVMERIRGGDLRQHLRTHGTRWQDVVELFVRAGRGLAAAHDAGIVHGDFKPENVLVDDRGEVKVTDFGLSRLGHAPEHTEPAAIAGTPKYMAPEQWTGRAADARSDQFSFAVALHDALFADKPGRRAAAPAWLAAIVRRAMHADPAQRYADMAALLAALEPARRRRRTTDARVAAALVVLVGVAWLALKPPAATTSAAAEAEYTAGVQAVHDAALEVGVAHFARAIALDPGFAAAHLRYVIYSLASTDEQRLHIARAMELRARLSAHDRALLDATQRALLAPDAPYERMRRLEAAADQFPDDPELALLVAQARGWIFTPPPVIDLVSRALALDPTFALAYLIRARDALRRGDLDAALASATRCLEVSTAAVSCMRLRAAIFSLRGDCAAMARQAQAMVTVAPTGDGGYEQLALALAATGAPAQSISEAQRRRELRLADDRAQSLGRLEDEAMLAEYDGDFATAERRLLELDQRAAPGNEFSRQTLELTLLYEEIGQPAKAIQLGEDYASKLEGWTKDAWGMARPVVLATLHRAGQIADREFAAERDAWVAEERAKNSPINAGFAWVDYYARAVRTADEAREALRALPAFAPLPQPLGNAYDLYHRQGIGHTYLLAGEPARAIAPLTVAARSCFALAHPWSYVHAQRDLGVALEALGDRAGACRAYGVVHARWGHARPSSVTADEVAQRSAALGCAE